MNREEVHDLIQERTRKPGFWTPACVLFYIGFTINY
jgi:hypothetical protein